MVEIDVSEPTEADNIVQEAGCPKCECDVIFATIGEPYYDIAYWHCMCGWEWETPRHLGAQQMKLPLNYKEKA